MFFTEEGTRAPVRKAITFRLRHARSVRFRFWQGMRSSAPIYMYVCIHIHRSRDCCACPINRACAALLLSSSRLLPKQGPHVLLAYCFALIQASVDSCVSEIPSG